ncbi:nitroreductase [Clostridia bacterium OttesenSCG-928-F22]|nr:nitroreductase [Clostridia bacterium OttesenSCG-928-F22]
MELQQCLETRRSIRNFNATPVSDETLIEIINAAANAPSWKNTQVTRYYAIRNNALKEEIAAKALPSFNQNAVRTAPVLLVCTMLKKRSGYTREGLPDTPKGDGWQMYDCGCSNMALTLKATELGLGTVIQGVYDEEKLAEIFPIPDTEEFATLIPIGYFDDAAPPMPKRKYADIILKIHD